MLWCCDIVIFDSGDHDDAASVQCVFEMFMMIMTMTKMMTVGMMTSMM